MRQSSFTLLEILTTMAILIILAGLSLGSFSFATKIAKKRSTKAQITAIEVALDQYKTEWGFYPQCYDYDTNIDGFPDSMALNEKWWDSIGSAPYWIDSNGDGEINSSDTPIEKDLIDNHELGLTEDPVYKYVDVYGNPFYYQGPSSSPINANMMNPEKFDLWSIGPDGMHGDSGSIPSDAQKVDANDSDDITNWK